MMKRCVHHLRSMNTMDVDAWQDPQFIELADEINCLLGINYSPSESWESLSDNCQKLNEEKDRVSVLSVPGAAYL